MADTPQIIELTDENFAASINDHPFAVVDFWAPWCAPCRAFAPVFAAAAVKYPDVRFAKVNTEEQQQLAGHFNIRSIPTIMAFREDQPSRSPSATDGSAKCSRSTATPPYLARTNFSISS